MRQIRRTRVIIATIVPRCFVRDSFYGAFLLSILVTTTGCYHHNLLTFNGAQTAFHKIIQAGPGHPVVVPPPDATGAALCSANGFDHVVFSSNPGFAVVTVATFGLWSPVRVDWDCAAPIPRVGPSLGGPVAAPSNPPLPTATTSGFTYRTAYSLVWGGIESDARAPTSFQASPLPPPPTPLNCAADPMHLYGMRRAKASGFPKNYLFSIATLATAGFYSPMRIGWECVSPASTAPAAATPEAPGGK